MVIVIVNGVTRFSRPIHRTQKIVMIAKTGGERVKELITLKELQRRYKGKNIKFDPHDICVLSDRGNDIQGEFTTPPFDSFTHPEGWKFVEIDPEDAVFVMYISGRTCGTGYVKAKNLKFRLHPSLDKFIEGVNI